MRALLCVVLVATAFAGCVGNDDADPAPPEPLAAALSAWDTYLAALAVDPDAAVMPDIHDAGAEDRPRVVVAVVDTGVNPFHGFFRRDATLAPGSVPVAAVDAKSGEPARYVPIQPVDDFVEDALWLGDALEGERLYRFAGTNLFFYSTLAEVPAPDPAGHGTATAATVLANAPDAFVVLVQAKPTEPARAVDWAAAQPWIDIVSVSAGCLVNCAPEHVFWQTGGPPPTADASRAVWASGKLYVNSAGNDPTPSPFDQMDGPPWAISVGGADPYRRGEGVLASKMVDVIANLTVAAPDHDSIDAWHHTTGTSFAAPTVAGTLAEAVLGLRRAVGHTGGISDGALAARGDDRWSNADVRGALNQSAVYWSATDYDLLAPHPDPIGAGIPIAPGAPWLQMGWGFADRSIAPTMVDVLTGGSAPPKDPAAIQHMATQQALREALWT